MDPVTAISLIASVQDLLVTTYNVGKDTLNAKAEIRALSVELSSLKSTLEHIAFILGFAKSEDDEGSDGFLNNSALFRPEYQKRLKSIIGVLIDLYDRIKARSTQLGKVWQITTWHWQKGEFDKILQKLEREKSWFTVTASSETLGLTRESLRSIRKVEGILEDQETTRKSEEEQALQNKVREWLAPHSTESFYYQSLDRLQAGTGTWLYDSNVFEEWVQGHSEQGLWLRARPGFGKTTLMAGAVDTIHKLQDSLPGGAAIAYWFCSLTETSSRELNNLLGGLIYQLGYSNPLLFSQLVDARQAHGKRVKRPGQDNRLGLDELKRLFRTIAEAPTPFYILIDAVNESKDAEKLMTILNEMLGDCKNLRIFVSSNGTTVLDADISHFDIIATGRDTNAMDIDSYIRAQLLDQPILRRLSKAVKEDILAQLNEGADGVFRWVDCQLQALALQRSPRDIQKALLCLPKTLEQSYQQSLDQLPENDRHYADRILFWLCFAYRRMSPQELCEAVILDEDEVFDPGARFSDPFYILEICPSLLDFDQHQKTLGLAHSSVFDYVNKFIVTGQCKAMSQLFSDDTTDDDKTKAADTKIASICLSYIMLPEFSHGWIDTTDEYIYEQWLDGWPLLGYISVFLWTHLKQVDLDGSVGELLKRFIGSYHQTRNGNFGIFLQSYYVHQERTLPGSRLDTTTPLYWAARSGNSSVVRMILQSGGKEMLERKGGLHACTPLHVASWAGRTEVVKALLEAGADVHETNEKEESGLDWAMFHGWHDIVEILMKAGGQPTVQGLSRTDFYKPKPQAIRRLSDTTLTTPLYPLLGVEMENLKIGVDAS